MYDSVYKQRYTIAPIATYKSDDGEKTHLHWHEETEIIYIEKGRVEASVGSENFVAAEGDFIFVNPAEIHSYQPLERQCIYRCICADCELIADMDFRKAYAGAEVAVLHHITKGTEIAENILPVFLKLYDAIPKSNKATYMECSAYLSLIFAEFVNGNLLTGRTFENKNEIFCKKVIGYIDANYDSDISSKQIASDLFYTHSYFCRFFRKNFGTSFSEYVRTYRILKSKTLLKNKSVKIYDIATECGFSSPEYFARVFKMIVGLSPKEYREQVWYLKPNE